MNTNKLSCRQYIDFAKKAITNYPNLTAIIESTDYTNWLNKLNESGNVEDYVFGSESKLNLLNTSIIVGMGEEYFSLPMILTTCKSILNKVECYLNIFPELKQGKSFKGKIKNLGKVDLLSTLSELAIAAKLKEGGLNIEFETEYGQSIPNKKNVDITAITGSGNKFHIEVYMPILELNIAGFSDLKENDSHYAGKIKNKFRKQLGQEDITDLNGMILLAVNKAFVNSEEVKSALLSDRNENIYHSIQIPKYVNGIIVFEDNFSCHNSFRFDKIYMKIKTESA